MNLHASHHAPRRAATVASALLAGVLLLAACSPIIEEEMRPWEATRIASLPTEAPLEVTFITPEPTLDPNATITPEAAADAPAEATAVATAEAAADVADEAIDPIEGAPTATIGVPILRVRLAPSTAAEVIGVVYADQIYPVIGRSSDGLWMQLGDIPGLPQESGWVISELALVIGDFSLIPVVQVPDEPAVAPSRQTEEGSGQTPGLPTPTPRPIATLAPTQRAPASGATPIGETTNGGPATDGAGTDNTGADGTATPEPAGDTAAETPVAEATAEPAAEEPAADEPSAEEPSAAETPAPVAIAPNGATLPDGVEPPPAGFALVITEGVRLRVRDLPNTDSTIVGYAFPGETFRVLQQSDDGAWTQINGSPDSRENPDGGWVASEFLYFGQ